jgi:integron integrase
MPASPPRLLDQVRAALQRRHYSPRTEEAYVARLRRFILFHDKRHPRDMGATEIEAFLTDLAVKRHVAASTQNQALAALLFLCRHVLHVPLDDRIAAAPARRPRGLPTVLTPTELQRLLHLMSGPSRLMAMILYGSGLRVHECVSLRVKDLNFERGEILVRDGKGGKARVTVLPAAVMAPLREHLRDVRRRHERDIAAGHGHAPLPDALDRKAPGASREWPWQYVFPSATISPNQRTGQPCRHHTGPATLQKAVHDAAGRANLSRRVTCRTLRHGFATHLPENGHAIRTIQELPGHSSVRTTMIYAHVLNRGGLGVRSPLDAQPGVPAPLHT